MTSAPPPATALQITPSAPISRELHGWRAKCLQRLVRMQLPVPRSFAIPADTVRMIAQGRRIQPDTLLDIFAGSGLSACALGRDAGMGRARTVLNVGINDALHARLAEVIGRDNADAVYLSFVQSYAIHIARLDPDLFTQDGPDALAASLRHYQDEMDQPFPQDPTEQLSEVLRSMARAWDGPTARLLRQAKGAPADAPLGLVVQEMALALGPGICGSGTIQFIDPVTGTPRVTGRFRGQRHGATVGAGAETLFLTRDDRGPALEDTAPEIFADLVRFGIAARERLREEMQIEFVVTEGRISVIDATRVARGSRAGVRIAVSLARDGIIPPEEALMRVEPRPGRPAAPPGGPACARDVIARGIVTSPGAATGRIVFSAASAQSAHARENPASWCGAKPCPRTSAACTPRSRC